MIPNNTFSIWLNYEKPPERIQECLKSQKVLLTLDDIPNDSDYLRRCISSESWVRAADFLRIWYLNKYGGTYTDADCELFGSFDKYLDNGMFVFKEDNGYLWNGCIGAEAGHPFLKYYLNTVERNFKIDGNTFDAGEQFFSEAYYISDRETLKMAIYKWQETKTILKHLEMNSWL